MLGLGSKVLAYIGGGLAALLAIALVVVTLQKNAVINTLTDSIERPNTGWRARLDACNRDRTTLRNNQAGLLSDLAKQNTAIDDLKAAAAARYTQSAADRASAAEALRNANAKAAALAKAQAGADACASANDLILESVK